MDSPRRICLITPDRWAGSFALTVRRHFPLVDVVCVGDAATGQACEKLGIATAATLDLSEGLKGAELVLVPQTDKAPELSLRNIVSSCGNNSTVCGHGRTLAEVNSIILDLSRQDVHYISIVARGTQGPGADISSSSVSDVRDQSIVLTPSKIDDLDALSSFQELLRALGARVSAMSPRVHDRQLSIALHLPRVILIPIIHYLAESQSGKNNLLSSDASRLLDVFSGLTPQNAKAWADELSRSRHHLLLALDSCLKHLAALREEIGTGQLQERFTLLAKQIEELSPETSFDTAAADQRTPSVSAASPETLTGIVNSLFTAVDRIAHGAGDHAPDNATEMLRELAAHTQSVLEHLKSGQSVVSPSSKIASPVLETVPEPYASSDEESSSEAVSLEDAALWPPEVPEVPAGPRHFDIQCRHDLNVMERMTRIMTGVHIAVTQTEEVWSEQGNRVIRVTLEDPEQIDRARELLRMAGIPLA